MVTGRTAQLARLGAIRSEDRVIRPGQHEITGAETESLYKDRSAFIHGSPVGFNDLSDQLIENYNRFERVLRLALAQNPTSGFESE
jgi:hypothetical protein